MKKIKSSALKKEQKKNTSEIGAKAINISLWAVIAVLAITALIYIRSLNNDFASLDDDDYIFNNNYIKNFSFDGIKQIFSTFYLGNYHPLTTLTYLFEYKLYGTNPFPYHLFNLILHLLNVWLVYLFIVKLCGNKLTALIVSLLFAVHPMHVESVAWISERKDVLYTFFYFLALIKYLDYLNDGFKTKHFLLSTIFFILSLLSKSAAVTFPVILLLIDWYNKRKPYKRLLLEKIPLLLLSVLFGVLALMSQQDAIKELSQNYSFFNRIFLFTYILSFYLIKLIVPIHLSAMHYYPELHNGFLPWYFYASFAFLLFFIWIILKRSSFRIEKIFGTLFFLIVISVMLQLIPVGNAIVAERYTYVSYVGLFYIGARWIALTSNKALKKLIIATGSLWIIFLCITTWQRIPVWKNGNTLFTDIINKYPNNYLAYWMRGNYKNNMKDYRGALEDYNKTLQLYPNFAKCLINRGQVYNELKNYNPALKDLNLAIQLDSTVAEAYNNRGMAYDGLGLYTEAMKDYNRAIFMNPKLQKAYNNRGVLHATQGNIIAALADLDMAIKLNPNDAEAYSNRANVYAMHQNYKASMEDYDMALKFKPNDKVVLFNRGITKLHLYDTAGACADWHKALQLGNEAALQVINNFCK